MTIFTYSGMTRYKSIVACMLLFSISTLAWGEDLAGLWQEYNDDTGNVDALIRIEKAADNTYEGKIEKVLAKPVDNPTLICKKCRGDLRNRPFLGLRILSGMKRKDNLNFEGGEILDPDDGETFKCQIRLSEDGNTIQVTGYIGVNWIGQSEIWRRASQNAKQ